MGLGLEEQLRIARIRDADLGVVRRFLSRQASDSSPEALLSDLAHACTQGLSNEERRRAACALIGALPPQSADSGDGLPVASRSRSREEPRPRASESG